MAIIDSGSARDVPDLVPARMLNEFTYFPRPAWLEWGPGRFRARPGSTARPNQGAVGVDAADEGRIHDPASPGRQSQVPALLSGRSVPPRRGECPPLARRALHVRGAPAARPGAR